MDRTSVPFSASFYYVQTQLQVTGTSPAVGSVLTVPDTDQTDLVVQFNKAFNPTTINTSDFQVSQGSRRQRRTADVAIGRPDTVGHYPGRIADLDRSLWRDSGHVGRSECGVHG